MREHIHTIPVLEALHAPDGCPFCVMREKLTNDAVAFIMGPAYMEDDVRMETDKQGFCAAHLDRMYAEQNRLGLALMLHTHMKRLNRETGAIAENRLTVSRFKKPAATPVTRLRAQLDETGASCYVCRKVEDTFARYLDTFFTLWSTDKEAEKLISAVPGYCLPHFSVMLAAAEERLNKQRLEAFLSVVLPVQQKFMKEMENDLAWFTLKFDYRNVNEPWKNAKDALPRAMALLNGRS